jgi:hypothetical protein
MPLTQLAGPTIAAGESLSSGLDCTQGVPVRIYTPAGWTPANLTFQLSFDGITYRDLVDRGGAEVVAAVKPNAVIILQQSNQQLAWFKVRSGTSAAPVPQAAQRVFATTIQK